MLLCISKWMHIVTYIAYDKDCNYAKYSRGSYWSISKPPVLFLFNKNFVGNSIFFLKQMQLRSFWAIYTQLWGWHSSYPVMVKVVFWSWETHVTLCVHWVWDRKREKSSTPPITAIFSHFTCLPVPEHLIHLWKSPPPAPANAAKDTDGQTTHSQAEDFTAALTHLYSALMIRVADIQTRQPKTQPAIDLQRGPLNQSHLALPLSCCGTETKTSLRLR